MFDNIIVPKSYLRGILNKKDEKLFDTQHQFQTKDLENSLAVYKIYRKQLYIRHQSMDFPPVLDGEPKLSSTDGDWDKVPGPSEISFYDTFTDESGDEHWFEFKFTFVNGKLDSKEVVDHSITNKKEREDIQIMWDIEQKIFDEYRKNWSYRFWTKVERLCQKLVVKARNQHAIPFEIRKTAYKLSGRLEQDPKCLDLYIDN